MHILGGGQGWGGGGGESLGGRPSHPTHPCLLGSCSASILALSSIRSRDTSCLLSSSSLVRTWWLTKSSSRLSFPLCPGGGDTGQAGGPEGGARGSLVLSLPSRETSTSFVKPGKLTDPWPTRSPSLRDQVQPCSLASEALPTPGAPRPTIRQITFGSSSTNWASASTLKALSPSWALHMLVGPSA